MISLSWKTVIILCYNFINILSDLRVSHFHLRNVQYNRMQLLKTSRNLTSYLVFVRTENVEQYFTLEIIYPGMCSPK